MQQAIQSPVEDTLAAAREVAADGDRSGTGHDPRDRFGGRRGAGSIQGLAFGVGAAGREGEPRPEGERD